MFSAQVKDAYKFLEVDPSSLPTEEWQRQHDHVMEELKKIKPPQPAALNDTEETS